MKKRQITIVLSLTVCLVSVYMYMYIMQTNSQIQRSREIMLKQQMTINEQRRTIERMGMHMQTLVSIYHQGTSHQFRPHE